MINERAKNPVPRSFIAQAANLYREFSGHDADYYQKIPVEWPDVALTVGECDGILYSTIRDGTPEKYVHKFKKSARPLLVASHDGRILGLIGGNFRFTDRGITDY